MLHDPMYNSPSFCYDSDIFLLGYSIYDLFCYFFRRHHPKQATTFSHPCINKSGSNVSYKNAAVRAGFARVEDHSLAHADAHLARREVRHEDHHMN